MAEGEDGKERKAFQTSTTDQGDGSSKGEGNIRIEAFLMPTKVKKLRKGFQHGQLL